MSAKVQLLNYTPNPEQTVAMSAKLCYSKSDIDDVKNDLTEEKTASFLNMLSSFGHQSPIEHVTFTFGIEGISRACSHQLVRHRIASYSQQSQRYVDGTSFEFVTPPEIAKNPDIADKYIEALETESRLYAEIRNALIVQKIKEYVQSDGDAELALGDLSIKTDEEITDIFKEYDKKRFSGLHILERRKRLESKTSQ